MNFKLKQLVFDFFLFQQSLKSFEVKTNRIHHVLSVLKHFPLNLDPLLQAYNQNLEMRKVHLPSPFQ